MNIKVSLEKNNLKKCSNHKDKIWMKKLVIMKMKTMSNMLEIPSDKIYLIFTLSVQKDK